MIIEAYRDKLDYIHPVIRSIKFLENAYSKWACDEILGELKNSGDLPFDMTALDILEGFVEKAKKMSSEHRAEEHRFCFNQAAIIGEYFIEQYWFNGLGEN